MKRKRVEWTGAILTMPGYVTDESGTYQPEMLIWMTADRMIVGSDMGKPGEMLGRACASLQQAMESPIIGEPHAPTRVRVASSALMKRLRSGHPDIEFVCGPTPEIDAVVAAMTNKLMEREEVEESYLSPDVGPEVMAGLFRAVAALFRAEPWSVVPLDDCLLSVNIAEFGVKDAVLGIIGQSGRDRGMLLFSRIADVDHFLGAGDDDESGVPPHLGLSFANKLGLNETMRQELAQHGWEVAEASAIPRFLAVDEDRSARSLSATEVGVFEALARALPEVLKEKKALLAAWNGGECVERTISVPTHRGDVTVSFRIPWEQEIAEDEASSELMGKLMDLVADDEEIDFEALRPLLDEIEARFSASPEAEPFDKVWVSRMVMDYAAEELNVTVANLGPEDLAEILFEVIPRKVSVEASKAKSIIDECRAFFTFLRREFGHTLADACLEVVDDDAVEELEAALSDPTNFGMAKSFVMGGMAAGFDMTTEEGSAAWLRAVQAKSSAEGLSGPSGGPSLGAPLRPMHRVDPRAKKNQRKAARKARKKNR